MVLVERVPKKTSTNIPIYILLIPSLRLTGKSDLTHLNSAVLGVSINQNFKGR
jgi:hypothetical protein